jgi:glyoxylase-like metal-dependent hydrolase (beta-lactamase superfamily II)/rhodanese-related sulfurtransferase
MAIEILELNGANCRTYMLVAGSAAALVDPVRERLDEYRTILSRRSLQLELVLETHTHADHLMLNRAAKEILGAPVLMHRDSPSPIVDRHLVHGDALVLSGERIDVIHTPGHTPDSVCYRVAGSVLTGDTLMIGTTGRTDFPGGNAGDQYESVTHRLFCLPDETLVLPAHDYKGQQCSRIGDEKRSNPRFVGKTREEYVTLMANLGLPFPEKIQQSLQVNQSGFEASEVPFPPVLEIASLAQVEPATLESWLKSVPSPLLLDVREPEEFVGELGHIPGALLVPLDALEHRFPKLAGYVDREVVVICRAGARSATAGAMLQRAGFRRVHNLAGGMLAWTRAGFPTQR